MYSAVLVTRLNREDIPFVTAAECLRLKHPSGGAGSPSLHPKVSGGGHASVAWNIVLSVTWQQFYSRSVELWGHWKIRAHLGARVFCSLILVALK